MPRLATLYCSDFVKVEDDGDRCRGWAAGVCGAQYRAEFIKRNIRSQQDPSATQRVGGGGGGGGGVGGGVCRGAPYFTPAGRRMRRRCRRARPRLRLLNAALTVTAAAAAAAGAVGGRR